MSLERLAMFDSSLISGTDQITWGGSEDEVYQERLTAALKAGLEIHKSLFEQEYQARMRASSGYSRCERKTRNSSETFSVFCRAAMQTTRLYFDS